MWIAYAQWSILELFGYRLLTHRIRIVSYTLRQPAPITNCMEHALFFIFSCFSRQFIHNNVAIEIVQCIRCYCALWSQAHGKYDKSAAVCVLCVCMTFFSKLQCRCASPLHRSNVVFVVLFGTCIVLHKTFSSFLYSIAFIDIDCCGQTLLSSSALIFLLSFCVCLFFYHHPAST